MEGEEPVSESDGRPSGRPRPQLASVRPPTDNDPEVYMGYDWRGVWLMGIFLAFAGFTMWLYH